MAAMMFMKVTGVTGEATDDKHKDWSDIRSFSWGASQPGGMVVGGGAGRASFNDLQVVAYMDKATPALIKHCASGLPLGSVVVHVCKSTGTKKEFCVVTLENVLVTSAQIVGVDPQDTLERLVMNYGFQAAKVRQAYTDKQGNGASSPMGWNITDNVEM